MRILIVEDEKEIADGITGILKAEGYEVEKSNFGICSCSYRIYAHPKRSAGKKSKTLDSSLLSYDM